METENLSTKVSYKGKTLKGKKPKGIIKELTGQFRGPETSRGILQDTNLSKTITPLGVD